MLARFLPRWDERLILGALEPTIAVLAGLLTIPASEGLGSFLAVAGLALAARNGAEASGQRRQAMALRDAYLEQKALAERFRQSDGR